MEKNFQPTPLQRTVAEELAKLKSNKQIAKEYPITNRTITNWKQNPEFQKLIEQARLAYVKELKRAGFDLDEFLIMTMQEAGRATPSRNDGLRAADIYAKLRGLYPAKSKNQDDEELRKELESLSQEQLEDLLKTEDTV